MAGECVGLDIGSSTIKAVVLKVGRRETRLLNFGIEPLPPQAIVDGTIMDQVAVVEAITRLKEALGFKNKLCATAIAGHSVIVKKISLPPIARDDLNEQVPLEAEQHIPFKRDEVDIDYQVITPKNAQGLMEVILVAAKKEMIADTLQVIREAKLQPVVVDVAAFCLQNAYEVGYGIQAAGEPVALIHIGHAITHVNILAGGNSVFARDVTVGGAQFTEEIQRRLPERLDADLRRRLPALARHHGMVHGALHGPRGQPRRPAPLPAGGEGPAGPGAGRRGHRRLRPAARPGRGLCPATEGGRRAGGLPLLR
ncbi:MAG: type IV pilus assembly protein PilM, partial [Deltaproteobacteria bacterium]|nr:type IV pilus assembly protein PilM [Deltaproteobacteria bacterium]